MQIVTLITDFGLEDHYAGILKGALLSQNSALNIVDITHNVKNFDIVHAAFILKNTYAEFPKGTIHLMNVMTFPEKKSKCIVFEIKGHFFIGPDNGIFSLAFDDEPKDVYILESEEEGIFAFKNVYAKAVVHILSELPMSEIGTPTERMERRISLQPVVSNGQLNGSVIHVDGYGNVILNIDKLLFNQVCRGREFSLFFKRHEPITKISKRYSDVPVGDLLCLFNSANHLEIALNMDRVSEKYSLKIDDTVILKLD
jgi:S-adenosylmethionine hydrolase